MEFTHIQATLAGDVLDLVIAQWQELAAEHSASGRYASELTFERMVPYGGSDPTMVAVQNVAPYAQVLEDGHAGFHLPSVIDWGAAEGRGTAKRMKDGRRYMTIPFRHFTPGSASGGISSARARAMMPQQVYQDALIAFRGDRAREEARDAARRIREAGTQLSRPYDVLDRMYPGAGGRGPSYFDMARKAEGRDNQPGYSWRTRTYEGLRRKEQVNPETGATSSVYSTLRTLTEDSLGWYVPPAPGFHFAARTVELVRPMARELLEDAARADVVELVRQVMSGEAA